MKLDEAMAKSNCGKVTLCGFPFNLRSRVLIKQAISDYWQPVIEPKFKVGDEVYYLFNGLAKGTIFAPPPEAFSTIPEGHFVLQTEEHAKKKTLEGMCLGHVVSPDFIFKTPEEIHAWVDEQVKKLEEL